MHTLTQWPLLPPLSRAVKSSLFTHVHSYPLSLTARLHLCHANHSRYINNGGTFSRQTSYALGDWVHMSFGKLRCPISLWHLPKWEEKTDLISGGVFSYRVYKTQPQQWQKWGNMNAFLLTRIMNILCIHIFPSHTPTHCKHRLSLKNIHWMAPAVCKSTHHALQMKGEDSPWSRDTVQQNPLTQQQSSERWTWVSILRQCFSNSNVNKDDLEIWGKCRLWSSKSRTGLKSLHFQSTPAGWFLYCSTLHRLRSKLLSDKV